MREINKVIQKVKEKENRVIFSKIGDKEDLFILELSDASYHQEGNVVSGELVLLGNRKRLWCLHCIGGLES